MEHVTPEQAEEQLNKGARKVNLEKLDEVLKKQEEIENVIRTNGPLTRFLSDIKLLFGVVQDYAKGEYREIPWWSIAAIVAALFYVVNPFDLIPDWIPIVGYADDAAVMAACLKMVEMDLHNYSAWKEARQG